jgi:hypothetical protein
VNVVSNIMTPHRFINLFLLSTFIYYIIHIFLDIYSVCLRTRNPGNIISGLLFGLACPVTMISIIISCVVPCILRYHEDPEKKESNGFTFPHFDQSTSVNEKTNIVPEQTFYKVPETDWQNIYEHTDRENIELKLKVKRLEYSLDISNKAYNELQKFV